MRGGVCLFAFASMRWARIAFPVAIDAVRFSDTRTQISYTSQLAEIRHAEARFWEPVSQALRLNERHLV
jgi:hypothetical protein